MIMSKKLILFLIGSIYLISNLFSQNPDIDILNNINSSNHSNFLMISTNSAFPITIGIHGGLFLNDYFKDERSKKILIIKELSEKSVILLQTEGLKYVVNRF